MSSSLSSIGTLFTFCCRHFFVAWFHPDHFVIIVSEVRTLKESVSAEIVEVDGVLQPTGKYHLGQKQVSRHWSMRGNEFNTVQDLCRGLGARTKNPDCRRWTTRSTSSLETAEDMEDTGQMRDTCTNTRPFTPGVFWSSISKPSTTSSAHPPTSTMLRQSQPLKEAFAMSGKGKASQSSGLESATAPRNSPVQDSEMNEVPKLPQCMQQQQLHQLHLSVAAADDADCPLSDAKVVYESPHDEAEPAEAQAAASTTEGGIRPPPNILRQPLWCLWCMRNIDLSARSRAAAAGAR